MMMLTTTMTWRVHICKHTNHKTEAKATQISDYLYDYGSCSSYDCDDGYYSYDDQEDNQIKTYEGTYYYPQSGINILVGLDVKF